jgi:hypothetical protein
MMHGPLPGEPEVKRDIRLTLKKAEPRVTQANNTIMRLVLYTDDGMEFVYLNLSPNTSIEWVNRIVAAFSPFAVQTAVKRHGVLMEKDVRGWLERSIRADLKYTRFEGRGMWEIVNARPVWKVGDGR